MKEVFEQNPKLEKCFATADGQAFYKEDDAKNHAKSLEDKTVELVLNPTFSVDNDTAEVSELDQEMTDFEIAENEAAIAKLEAEANAAPNVAPLKVVKPAVKKS